MNVDFGWFLPTMGDSETIGPPTRPASLDYLVDVAKAAEEAGFNFALVPVGTTCQDAWLASAVVAGRTEKLKFLVAMRPGFIAPTVAAKMSNTLDQLTQGRVLINVVTGGYPAELAADGDFTEHDERYDRTQEFMRVVRKAWTEALIANIPEGYQVAMDKVLSRTDSEGEKRQQGMRAGSEDLVIAPSLWTGIGKARVGVGAALVGSGESVAARLREYVGEGIDTFILSGYPHLEEAQLFGKYVMPQFAGRRAQAGATAA